MIAQNNNYHVAVFDIGKTRSRLVVLDPQGQPITEASRASVSLEQGDYPHLDTDGLWHWMLDALANSGCASTIRDCVVVTHGAAFALLDDDSLVTPVMDYEFDDFGAVGVAYDQHRGDFSETLSPKLPAGLNAGRQIYYIQQTRPDVFRRVSSIVPYPQYWASRLCGSMATEMTSLGCHTDLWCPASADYSSLVRTQGWHQRMPPIVPAWESLGTVLPSVSEASGLPVDCRVRCGIHDSNASLLRHLNVEQARFCVVSTGTWVICMAGGHDLDRLVAEQDMLANIDARGKPTPCARFMGGREYAAITAGASPGTSFAAAHNVMRSGALALPSFATSGGPFSDRRGQLISAPDDDAERRALASLYCALMTDWVLDSLRATGDLIVEGRFVDDPIFLEALNHFRGDQKLRISDDATGSVGGAARLLRWPGQPSALPSAHDARGPANDYLRYRERWRDAIRDQKR